MKVTTPMDVSHEIKSIISDQLGVAADTLADDVHFRSLPNMSSMKVLQIILETEKRFDIELSDDVTFRVETIEQFQDEVEKLLAQQNTAPAGA